MPSSLVAPLLTPLVAALAVAGGTVWTAPAPRAEPPGDLADEITDTAGVLGGDRGDVQAALDRLAADTEYQLFVAFVDTFGDLDARGWTDATVDVARLGDDDVLLAVAVQDRAYDLSVGQNDLTDDQIDAVQADVEDRLREDDWAGAAIAAADGVRTAALGSGGSGGAGGGFPWLPLGLGAAGVA